MRGGAGVNQGKNRKALLGRVGQSSPSRRASFANRRMPGHVKVGVKGNKDFRVGEEKKKKKLVDRGSIDHSKKQETKNLTRKARNRGRGDLIKVSGNYGLS